jgi:hypothetical protein
MREVTATPAIKHREAGTYPTGLVAWGEQSGTLRMINGA